MGRTVSYVRVKKNKVRKQTVKDFAAANLYFTEVSMKASAHHGMSDGISVIDHKNISFWDNFSFTFMTTLLPIFSNCYIFTVRKIILINNEWVFNKAFNLMKSFIPK